MSRLTSAVIELTQLDMIELFLGRDYPCLETPSCQQRMFPRVVRDSSNWWTRLEHLLNTVDLVVTETGRSVFATHRRDNLYAFRQH